MIDDPQERDSVMNAPTHGQTGAYSYLSSLFILFHPPRPFSLAVSAFHSRYAPQVTRNTPKFELHTSTLMSAQTFIVNERVLCYHGPLIYEAKVLKVDNWDETTTQTGVVGPHYYVHYKGWKQT